MAEGMDENRTDSMTEKEERKKERTKRRRKLGGNFRKEISGRKFQGENFREKIAKGIGNVWI